MALQPFNFYFQSGAGSITVNGSPPASSYNDGTPLTIAVTFTDGSTDVEWIVNNTSEGTTNPLVINMPIGGIYLRILGTGAPEVTEQFRFFWRFGNGIGSLSVNGGTPEPYYEAGTSLEIETVLVPGFTFTDFDINDGLFTGLTNPYTFSMPNQDVDITVNSSGNYTPVETHGVRYFGEYCDLTGQSIEIEILEKDYAGYPEERKFGYVRYKFGEFGSEVLEPIVGSAVNFGIIGTRDEFFPLLDGGNRYWMVRMYVESSLFFEGYIQNSFLSVEEIGENELQAQNFTAVDGIKSFQSIRAIESYFTRISSSFEAMKTIAQAINQSFDNLRVSHVACSIYETRMDRDQGLFEQMLVPDNAVYEDGEVPVYTSSGAVKLNTSLYIDEVLRRILKPFICRFFLWKNEFYIISTPELNKASYTLYNYDVYGEPVDSETIASGIDLSCKFANGQRSGKPVYTEFTTKLKLGVLDVSASGGLIEYDFGIDDWILLGNTTPYPGRYQLKNWKYVNCRPSNRPDSYPEGSTTALVQFVGDTNYCKIWGTTSTAGTADANISYIEIDSYRNKNKIQVAQGISNTLAFRIEFFCEFRGEAPAPLPINQFCGIMIRVGSYYMEWDGNQTFAWTLTETVMQFPMLTNYTWNIVDIRPLEIPEDGIVTVRLYEVINDGATADRFTVGYRNMSVKIDENEAFTVDALYDKFITDTSYSSVAPEVELYIGDVRASNSSSAIKLNIPEFDYPVSSLWSIDGTTEIKLSQVMLQEMANLQGQQNPRITAKATRDGQNPLEIVPYQNVIYDNAYWLVIAIDLDFGLNFWDIELHKLGDIES